MIGSFPDPYPDELLYSVFARFQDRVMYPNRRATLRELFGTSNITATVDLPSHLVSLVTSLPPGHYLTVDRLIDNHTLLPFYAPFLPPERVARVRKDMEGPNGPAIHMRAGIMASIIKAPEWLRYCPICVEDDRRSYGEPYWHRLHQLPGIEVCPNHAVFLEDSSLRRRDPWNRQEFVTVNRVCWRTKPQPLSRKDPSHAVLFWLAADATWLLAQKGLIAGPIFLHRRYNRLLASRGLATHTSRVRVTKLMEAFKSHYGPEILARLQCSVDTAGENWLLRIVRSPNGSQHPLRHLLFIRFLGYKVDAFFALPEEPKPFGDGPWPCLNQASDHYRQRRVFQCTVSYRPRDSRPMATFRCTCGFVYSRTGPDRTENDRFRIDRVKEFGPVWEQRLKDLWGDPMVSLRCLAKRLGVDPITAKRHASRLTLSIERPGTRLVGGASKPHVRPSATTGKSGAANKYRSAWLSTIEKHPEAGVTAVRNLIPGVYAWLRRNDVEWLYAHMPPTKAPVRAYHCHVNWSARDTQLADAVRLAASSLKNKPNNPIRVTLSAIGKELGQLALLQRHMAKLPLTAKAVAESVEDRAEFAARRVQWAAQELGREGIRPERWQLVRRAGLRPDLVAEPQVERAIGDVLY